MLLVTQIKAVRDKSCTLEFSDGFYTLRGETIDIKADPRSNSGLILDLIRNKRLYPGLKLHCVGLAAEPSTNSQKVAESELASPKTALRLLVNYNGVSRAKADARLGLQKSAWFYKSVGSLSPYSGRVHMLDVIILGKMMVGNEQHLVGKDAVDFAGKNGRRKKKAKNVRVIFSATVTKVCESVTVGKRYKFFWLMPSAEQDYVEGVSLDADEKTAVREVLIQGQAAEDYAKYVSTIVEK